MKNKIKIFIELLNFKKLKTIDEINYKATFVRVIGSKITVNLFEKFLEAYITKNPGLTLKKIKEIELDFFPAE